MPLKPSRITIFFVRMLLLKVIHHKKQTQRDWMANYDWSGYKRQDFKALQQPIELEEINVSEEVDLIDSIHLDTLLATNKMANNAANFPLLNEFNRKSMNFPSVLEW